MQRHSDNARSGAKGAREQARQRSQFLPTTDGTMSNLRRAPRVSGSNGAVSSFDPLFVLVEQLAKFGKLLARCLARGKCSHHQVARGAVESAAQQVARKPLLGPFLRLR